ncbi:MAG: RRXRR domain-containing protein [Desulfovibrio sp.]|nr:RRXRR domain-containing protein [Desulfovibrio sp.]
MLERGRAQVQRMSPFTIRLTDKCLEEGIFLLFL